MSTLKTSVLISAQNLLSPHLERINKDLARVDARVAKTGKSFSNIAPHIRNAGIGMTAIGTATAFAIKKMTDISNEAAGVGKAFDNFFGSSAPQAMERMQNAVKNTVSEIDLMKAANQAVLLGIDPDALPAMFEGALAAAQATGQPVSKAINDITTGIGRQSKLILDNLGIIVNAEKANEQYAASIGKTASALSDAEKKAAFTAATMKALEENAKRIGPIQENNAIKMQQASASMANAVKGLGDAFAPAVASIAKVLQKVADKFNSLSPATKKLIGTVVLVGTAFALIAGPILTFIGTLGTLGAGFVALKGAMAVALTTLSAFALPITVVVGGLTALYLWTTKTDTGKKALAKTVSFLTKTFKTFWSVGKNTLTMMQAVWNVTEGFRKMVKDSATVAVSNFARWFTILKDNIGAGIGAVKEFANTLINNLVGAAKKAVEWLQKIPIIGKGIKTAMSTAGATVAATATLMSPATQAMADGAELVWTEYQTLQSEAQIASTEIENFGEVMKHTEGTAYSMGGSVEDLSETLAGGGGSMEKAGDDAEQLEQSISDLEDQYADAMQEINEKIFELEMNHKEKMESIRNEMSRVEDQIQDLESQYNDSVSNMQRGIAEKIIEEQEKINDLIERRKELESKKSDTEDAGRKSDIGEDISKLVDDIKKREDALNRVKEQGIVNEEELAEAQRRASLTSLERFIEDQESKREKIDEDFQVRQEQLNEEMAKLEEQAERETTLFNIKRQDYELTKIAMQQFHDNYLANLRNMEAVTQKTVDSMRKKLEELRSIISQIQALMRADAGGGSTSARNDRVSSGGSFVPKFSKGGSGDFGSGTMVELHNQEAIVPLPDGRRIPVEMKGGSGDVQVNIDMGGVSVNNQQDAEEVARLVQEKVVESMRNQRFNSPSV